MGFFNSIFGIDVFGTGKPGMIDDAVILGALEEEDQMFEQINNGFDEKDEAIASGAIDEFLDF